MKKARLVVLALALPFVASCNNSNTRFYHYKVSSCYGLASIEPGSVSKDKEYKEIDFEAIDDYSLPYAENIYIQFDNVNGQKAWISPADEGVKDEYCQYQRMGKIGKLKILPKHIKSDIDIKARACDFPLLDVLSWEKINEISEEGVAPYLFYIGEEKRINVNDYEHRVRILGFDHDDLANQNGRAGITFEFTHFISDENGYSLATPWNWDDEMGSNNVDYPNSNLRKVLDGEGDGTICWYEKGSAIKSNRNKSVLEMLPEELKGVLKVVKKPTAIYSESEKRYIVDLENYQTKLFPLSFREMTRIQELAVKAEGRIYDFYDLGGSTIKYQPKHHKGALEASTEITDQPSITTPNPISLAGYNYVVVDTGGFYWTRSPYAPYGEQKYTSAWCVDPIGGFENPLCFPYVYPVAPAFCI